MKRNIIFSILTAATAIGCDSPRSGPNQIVDCKFEFEIYEESPSAYNYNSKTGQLRKLINPFTTEPLYADTIVYISEKELCDLMTLCSKINVFNYPNEFNPESGVEVIPEPSFQIRFTIDGRTKEINWKTNTAFFETKEASDLYEVISKIDSLIYSTSEFQSLPEEQYLWE